MLIPADIKCALCSRIFCCSKCRKLHEEKEHAVLDKEFIHKSCFICYGKPFPLKKSSSKILMDHILEAHMPVHCKKCNKIYDSKDDFEEIEKCVGVNGEKLKESKENETENKENIPEQHSSSLPHKIIVEEIDEELLTPLSKINLKWRRKSAGLSISDSVASISSHHQNVSHVKFTQQTTVSKLVRTTSTPMNQLLPKPTNLDSLCGSSYQASSIDPSSGNETDQSASITSNIYSPSPAIAAKRDTFPMQRARQMRHRLPKAQTPLRQVMSKSIQRAIQQQRIERTKLAPHIRAPRKMTFDSMSSSDGSLDEVPSKTPQVSGVLDLRTTPVLKRTNSAPNPRGYLHKEENAQIPNDRPKSEESLIVDALIEEHYKRTDFRARIDAISDNVINETKNFSGEGSDVQTTNVDGSTGIFKSCLDDEENLTTPYKAVTLGTKKSARVTPMQSMLSIPDNSLQNDVWYTPKSISTNVKLPSPTSDHEEDDEVFTHSNIDDENQNKPPQNRIWRLFSNVFKMASGSLTDKNDESNEKNFSGQKQSLVTRSLTHFGLIRQRRTYQSPMQNLKRKRQSSSSQSSLGEASAVIPELRSPLAKKYKSITGRKPIQRMRSK